MSIKNLFAKYKKYSKVLNLLNKNTASFVNFSKYINNSRNTSKCAQILPKSNVPSGAKYSSEIPYISDSDTDIDSDYIEEPEFNNVTIPSRQILNPNNNDPLIAELNVCASVQEVFNFIKKQETKMDATHISQTVLVLWDLQKCFYKHNLFYQEYNINKLIKTNDLLRNYIIKVKTHDDFQKLLHLVKNNYENFTLDALSCCLLYLNRMGVDLKDEVMQNMIIKCEKDIAREGLKFPLTALSRFTVAIYGQEDSHWSLEVTKNILPVLLAHLDNCNSAQELKFITICLNKMHQLVTTSVLNKYKKVVEKLISEDKLTYLDQRCVLKALIFLYKPQWQQQNNAVIKKLFYIFKKHVHKLTDREVIVLFKVFQMQKEPADMLDEIQESASNRLSEKNTEEHIELTLDLLSCIVSFSSPLQRPKFEHLARQYIQNSLTSSSLTSLYKILYHIKSSDTTLCNAFWDQILTLVKKEDSKAQFNKLLNLCHKYMHFNRNGHQYRYYKFENAVINTLLYELEFGIAGYIPCKFSRMAAFIIAYNNNLNVLENITNKIKETKQQFSAIDCLNLSKGLQVSSENLVHVNSTSFHKYLNEINELLNECVDRELLKPNVSWQTINTLLRGHTLRKCDVTSSRFDKMLSFCSTEVQLSSNVLKDLSYMMQHNQCLVPDLIEHMVNHSIKNSQSLLGNTVDKVLHLCYNLGYTPKNVEDFTTVCSDLIFRDKERFGGLSFIQSSLALCYFNRLPEFLVKHIFSVEFLEKLDEELSHCYSKTTYPIRVRDHMMQLNRAVCLDYMECDVPWFHQKYVDRLKDGQAQKKNHFYQKVYVTLLDAIKEEKIISENVYTPYGYHIDFQINLGQEGLSNNSIPRKIALNILHPKAYTLIQRNLKGYYQLKKRHLEILGYEVLYEDQHAWKELYSQEQCISYMKHKIWSSSSDIQLNSRL